MSTSDCPRRGKWIGGCRFEGRYHTDSSGTQLSAQMIDAIGRLNITFSDEKVAAIAAANGNGSSSSTYIGDICTRCGRWVNPPLTGQETQAKDTPAG